jgi:hypothetical protein
MINEWHNPIIFVELLTLVEQSFQLEHVMNSASAYR